MIDQENKEQKLKTKNALLSNKLISEVLPTVKEIKIEYIAEHNSAFGKKVVENIIIRTSQSKDNYFIDCPNRECTSIGFDLKNEIRRVVSEHKVEEEGTLYCSGSEAPDHLYQSCGSTLKYKIIVEYNL